MKTCVSILVPIRSSRQEVFCNKGVLRNFTKFTEKHLCQSLFFNKVGVEHLWWLLLNVTVLFNQMQPKIKKSFFNISIKGTLMQIRKSANILSLSQENNMLQISYQNTFYFLRYVHVRYLNSLFTNMNMLKISLLFKTFTNFTGKLLKNCPG